MIRAALLLFIALVLAPRARALTVYTDRTLWEEAVVGPVYTESFDLPEQIVPTFAGGVLHTPAFDILIGQVHESWISQGLFHGDVHPLEPNGLDAIVFNMPGVSAFGVDVLSVEDSLPLGFDVDGQLFFASVGFFGVTSESSLGSSITIRGGSAPRFFNLDNVSLAPVPEPEGLAVLTVAALVLSSAQRRLPRAARPGA